MFERIKNFFSSGSGTSIFGRLGQYVGGLAGQIFRPEKWLQWFKVNPRMRPIDKIANDVAGIGLKVIDKNGEVVENSEALNLIEFPNEFPEYDSYSLMWISTVYYKILGEFFWWVVHENGKPIKIFPIPPSWVEDIPRSSKTYYTIQTSDGARIHVPKEHMVYQKRPDISEPFKRGVGVAQQVGDELQIDEYMSKHQNAVFKNDGMPPIVASLDGSTKPQRDRFAADWQQNYSGVRNRGKMAVVDGKAVTFQILQTSLKDLDFLNSRKFVNDIVLQHFSISKELMGNTENANRASITMAQEIYERNELKVTVEMYKRTFKRQYMPMFKTDEVLTFNDYLTEDKEFNYKDADAGWNNGLYTRNQALIMKGMDTVPGGDVYKTGLSTIFIPAEKAKSVFAEESKAIEIEFTSTIDEFKERIYKALDDSAEAVEKTATERLKSFFKAQGRDVNTLYNDSVSGTFLSQTQFDELVTEYFRTQNEKLGDILMGIWSESAKLGNEIANAAYSLGVSWEVVNPLFLNSARTWAGYRVTQINENTRKQINDAIVKGIENGESIEDIANRLEGVYEIADRSRANAIARTETHTATVAGTNSTYKEAGIGRVEWMTSLDGREREWHGSMDGQVIDIDDFFVSGLGNLLAYPGDPNAPAEEVVNCRCVLLPVID